jgi:hypothetical protein
MDGENGKGYVWFENCHVFSKDMRLLVAWDGRIVPLPVAILHPDCRLAASVGRLGVPRRWASGTSRTVLASRSPFRVGGACERTRSHVGQADVYAARREINAVDRLKERGCGHRANPLRSLSPLSRPPGVPRAG